MLGVQFALTARFRRATAPFGIDIVYYFHRYLALAALAIVAAHWLLLKLWHPDALGSADPGVAPPAMTAGRVSLFLFGVLRRRPRAATGRFGGGTHGQFPHACRRRIAIAAAAFTPAQRPGAAVVALPVSDRASAIGS